MPGPGLKLIKKVVSVAEQLARKAKLAKMYPDIPAAKREAFHNKIKQDVKTSGKEAVKSGSNLSPKSASTKDRAADALAKRKAAQQKQIDDSYKKKGGNTMKYKTGGMTNPNKKAAVNPKGPKGKMGYGMKMTGLKKMGKKK